MTADTQPAANPMERSMITCRRLSTDSRRTSVCVGCGSQILDQYIMHVAPDLKWHAGCLKCADCHQYLDESCTCFVKDGKTYCKRDYVRLFGIKCQRCGDSLSKGDFVMRAKNDSTYHIDCFRCSMCRKQLIPGDEYVHREDGIYCRADHAELVDKTYGSPGSPGQTNNVNNNNNSSKVNNNNNVNGVNSESGCPTPVDGKAVGEKPERGSGKREEKKRAGAKEHKTTRVRTVLNEKQLHTLRTCYGANPRPDALMKEQLTEMTGLSPRVIRVWFQNKRCKDKKRSILIKQMQSQQEKHGWKMRPHYFYCLSEEMSGDDEIEITHSAKGGGGLGRPLQGVPMVAGEPVRHEPPPGLAASAVEVQTYQPPWKALADFAMHGELDHPQPPFQQLIHSFDHMDHGMHGPGMGSSPNGEGMLTHYLPPHHPHHPHHPHALIGDDMSNSVESDFQTTSSGLSSPISQ